MAIAGDSTAMAMATASHVESLPPLSSSAVSRGRSASVRTPFAWPPDPAEQRAGQPLLVIGTPGSIGSQRRCGNSVVRGQPSLSAQSVELPGVSGQDALSDRLGLLHGEVVIVDGPAEDPPERPPGEPGRDPEHLRLRSLVRAEQELR